MNFRQVDFHARFTVHVVQTDAGKTALSFVSTLNLLGELMQLINILQRHLQSGDLKITDWTPSDNISRQKWQEVVEEVVAEIRLATRRPAFGLSDSEISVHYHRPLDRFVQLVRGKLGIDPGSIT